MLYACASSPTRYSLPSDEWLIDTTSLPFPMTTKAPIRTMMPLRCQTLSIINGVVGFMEDIKQSEGGTYRRVGYTVTLIGSTLGQWTFRVDVYQSDGWVAGNTFISPGFYSTDTEARKAAIELSELYIDRQLLSHKS